MSRPHGGLILAAFDVPMHSRRQTALSTEEDYLMTEKTKQGALKAAYKALGNDAVEGVDFKITNTGAGFTHESIDPSAAPKQRLPRAKATQVKASEVKDKPKTKTGGAGKKPPAKPKPAATPAPRKAAAEGPTKTDLLIALMQRAGGATSAEMQEAAGGWAPHSVRGLLGTLRAKGHVIESKKLKGEPTIYHMPKAAAAAPSEDVV